MDNRTYWVTLGKRASQDLFAWSSFVARTEFLWQDSSLVKDSAAWQRIWFELEIVNGLALAQWEDEGRPEDWSSRWREAYQQEAAMLAAELLALMSDSDSAVRCND